MINEAQDTALSNRMKQRQDAKIPFLINIEDGRLVPNVAGTRELPNYRPYHGPAKAPLEARLMYLRTEGRMGSAYRPLTDSSVEQAPPVEPFDIATASRDDLINFAFTEYGKSLDPTAHLATIKKQVREFARIAGALKGDHADGAADLT